MHLWDGNEHTEEYWVPYIFYNTPVGKIKSVDGCLAEKRSFRSYQDYYQFCKNERMNILENNVRPEIQYLAETFHHIPDDEMDTPTLKIYYLDIEVRSTKGFPHASLAEAPVTLISVRDSTNNRTVTFGEKEYTAKQGDIYIHCPDERELLRKFFAFMHKYTPDVISGWYVQDFDLAYLINRDKNINNGKYFNLMSSIGKVRTWMSKKDNRLNIDIAGVTILDYIDLYKWYSPNKLESHSLEFVSMFELGEGKLDYSDTADDLRELYEKDWDKYVKYNIMDCKRVHDLGKKLGYIRLVQSLSLLTRVPMKNYNAMTSLIEGVLLVYYRRNSLCAPFMAGGTQEHFPAAYVKEPQKGMHNWLFSIDIQSSYPSHIITLNMSNETYFGRILGMSDDSIIKCLEAKKFPAFDMYKETGLVKMDGKKLTGFNKALERKLFSIAPCGTIFVNDKPGVISTVERSIFEKRIEVKKRMREAEGDERKRLHTYQHALKIILNAMFGIMAVPYSRYFNIDIAEAITSCGRHTMKSGARMVNQLLNNPDLDKNLLKVINKY